MCSETSGFLIINVGFMPVKIEKSPRYVGTTVNVATHSCI